MEKRISMLLTLCFFIFTMNISTFALSDPEVTAPAAVLMEAKSGNILYSKNQDEVRPCASITKVMTLLLVMEALESGSISLTDQIAASEHAASMGGSDIWLKAGEVMSVYDLIKATAVASANDAAVVLAEYLCVTEEAFVEKMNERAKALGMTNTNFKNCNGLDEDGHTTSALDVAIMSRELVKHKKIFDYTGIWMDFLRDGKTQIVNTNKLLKSYGGITGLKTGTTSKAGSCISATASKNDLDLIAVVLGCANTNDRFNDAKTLLDFGFANHFVYTPEFTEDGLEPVNVENGMQNEVEVTFESPKSIVIPKSDKNRINSNVVIDENITAPIEKGQVLGKLEFKIDDKVICESDITASRSVEAISFSSIFNLLLNEFLHLE